MRYAIFDFDGTLADSMGMWRSVANEYLFCHGYERQPDLSTLNNSVWVDEFIRIAKERLNFDIVREDFFKWSSEYALAQYASHLQLKPSVMELLDKLYSMNVKMCICSASLRVMTQAMIQRLNLEKYFSFSVHCPEFGSDKDCSEIFYHCMEKLGAELPKDVVVFEDATYAAKTARSAGFYVVGIYDSTESDNASFIENVDQYVVDYSQLDFNLLP